MISEFRRLIELPDARALRILDRARQGDEFTDLEVLPDEVVSALFLRLHLNKSLATDPAAPFDPRLADLLNRIEPIRRSRGLRALAKADEEDRIDEISKPYGLAIEIYAGVDHDKPDRRLKRLEKALKHLFGLPHDLTPERRQDLAKVIVDLSELKAFALADLGLPDAADVAFRQALERAGRADEITPAGRLRRRSLLRYTDWLAKRSADSALRWLLPVLQKETAGTPDADTLSLQVLMVNLYDRFGDHYAARETAADLGRDLERLGFADSRSGDYRDVIANWVEAAVRNNRSTVERQRLLAQALVGHLCLQANRAKRSSGSRQAQLRMRALRDIHETWRREQGRSHAEDEAYIANIDADSPSGQTAHPPEPDTVSMDRYAKLVDLREALGDTDEVVAAARDLAEDPDATPDYRARTMAMLGQMALNHMSLGAAFEHYVLAEELASRHEIADVLVEARTGVGMTLFLKEDYRGASKAAGAAISLVESMRRSVSTPYLGSAFMVDKWNLYMLGVNAARKARDFTTMFHRMELMKARNLRSRTPETHPLVAEMRHQVVELGSSIHQADLDSAKRRRLRHQRRAAWEQILLSQPSEPDVPFHLDGLQRRLHSGSVVISYFFLGESVLLASAISESSVDVERIEIDPEGPFYTAVQRIDGASRRTAGLELDFADVADVLLPASFGPYLETAAQVIVCAHQALHGIPFAALPWKGSPLIEGRPVGCVPNLTCLLQNPRVSAPGSGLVALATERSRNSEGMALDPLPEVREEARAAVACWQYAGLPTTLRLDELLDRRSLLGGDLATALAEARVVHVGLHGEDVATSELNEAPMECRLFLAEGPVDGLDLSTLDLTAEVVVLPACYAAKRSTSARDQARLPSDAVFGLQAAFHQAGAGSIVGSLWPANDVATPKLTLQLHQALAGGATASEALQLAILDYRRNAGPIFNDPCFWAGFTLIGFGPTSFGLGAERRGDL